MYEDPRFVAFAVELEEETEERNIVREPERWKSQPEHART